MLPSHPSTPDPLTLRAILAALNRQHLSARFPAWRPGLEDPLGPGLDDSLEPGLRPAEPAAGAAPAPPRAGA